MNQWLAWNLFFPLQEACKGHPTLRILREMEAADRLTPDGLQALTAGKLQNFIGYIYANVPYVRQQMLNAGVAPSDIRTPNDLRRLPIMRKSDVRNNRERLRSISANKLATYATSGSTGDPLLLDFAKRRMASHVACRQRVARWWGVSIGVPEVALWGAAPGKVWRQKLRDIRDQFFRTRFLSAYDMTETTMSRYADILARGNFRQIFSYPSAVYLLCLHAQKFGIDLRTAGIQVVFVTGEVLFPHQRKVITEVLGCPVANGYGGRDSGFVAHECPHGGLHIMSDAVIVEVLDEAGNPAPHGHPGEIVVTDLYSHEVPFLRYATGDIGVLSDCSCPCGRPLPLLKRIEGRMLDTIVAPDGRVIPGLALNPTIWKIEGIEQVRICQKQVDLFQVQLVVNDRFHKAAEETIRTGWSEVLRHPVDVTFTYVTALPVDRSGKRRFITSEVPRLPNTPVLTRS